VSQGRGQGSGQVDDATAGGPTATTGLLGPGEIRALAAKLGISPAKSMGQNFVHDPNTVRRIVRAAALDPDDVVVEVGPGLGSLTLALLPAARHVHAVEIDPRLAAALPETVAQHAGPAGLARLTVHQQDALKITAEALADPAPTALVANLPYNVAVPVVLHLLAELPTLRHGLVMVQQEVADRLTAGPGSKIYGVPSVKLAWYATSRQAGRVPASVFWPVPNVESGLVAFTRHAVPPTLPDQAAPAGQTVESNRVAMPDREAVFRLVDAAFAQRRKTLRAALAGWAGGPDRAQEIIVAAGVDPGARGESLTMEQFATIAAASRRS
jgi:16S rRNA (adenine1518-N6/adenine1519-N6)-dimethyltransferase